MLRTGLAHRIGRWWVAPFLPVLGAALVVAVACDRDNGDGETPAVGETPGVGENTAVIKMIPSIRFDKSELTIAADTNVTITVENTDEGVQHNFAVYESEDDALSGEDPIEATGICTAPCVDTLTLSLGAGEYFFRCEVHPSQMTGTLIAKEVRVAG